MSKIPKTANSSPPFCLFNGFEKDGNDVALQSLKIRTKKSKTRVETFPTKARGCFCKCLKRSLHCSCCFMT